MSSKQKGAMPPGGPALSNWLTQTISTRSLPKGLDVSALPPIRFLDGANCPADVMVVLLKSMKPSERAVYEALCPLLDPTSMQLFARHLAQWWADTGAASRHRWALDGLTDWKNDANLTLVAGWLRVWIKKKKRGPAEAALRLLAQDATDFSLSELDDLAHGQATPAFADMARREFEFAAQKKGMSADELADRIVPTLGFDARGRRAMVVGKKTITASLRRGGEIELQDDQGKVVKSMPRSTGPEPTGVTPQDWWKDVRKRLKGVMAHQAGRLERAMVDGRPWPCASWRELFVDHPVLRTLTSSLVWSYRRQGESGSQTFRTAEDWSYADEKDDPIEVPPDAVVKVGHPVDWSEEVRRAWKEVFGDYSIEQPFPQVDRETFRLNAAELSEPSLLRFAGLMVDHRYLRSHLKRRGWSMAPPTDGGMIPFHFSVFERAGAIAVLVHDPVFIGASYEASEPVGLGPVVFVAGHDFRNREIDLSTIPTVAPVHMPVVVISEVIRDLQKLQVSVDS